MKTSTNETISRLPASRFPEPADAYFCDNCGRDLTKNLYRDRESVWQPLHPMWYVCRCGQKYLSGAAEWDDLTAWERSQRMGQLRIGFVLFALLVIPVTLAYFALRYGGAALLVIVGIGLIPSVLVAKPFWFLLLDLYEIIASVWRTRSLGTKASSVTTIRLWMMRFRPHKLRLPTVAAAAVVLIIAARWAPSHLVAASPVAALSSPERSSNARPEILSVPAKLPPSVTEQAAGPGAPSSAFRRVRVSPNEVDYVADDVTVRNFLPTPARPRAQAYKEVHIGEDVTIRYFLSKPELDPRGRPTPTESSLLVSQ